MRVKGGMSLRKSHNGPLRAFGLRNGMWQGLRNDIIMRNLIYRIWPREINETGKHARVSAAPFLAPV